MKYRYFCGGKEHIPCLNVTATKSLAGRGCETSHGNGLVVSTKVSDTPIPTTLVQKT